MTKDLKSQFLVESLDINTADHDRWEKERLIEKAKEFLRHFNERPEPDSECEEELSQDESCHP